MFLRLGVSPTNRSQVFSFLYFSNSPNPNHRIQETKIGGAARQQDHKTQWQASTPLIAKQNPKPRKNQKKRKGKRKRGCFTTTKPVSLLINFKFFPDSTSLGDNQHCSRNQNRIPFKTVSEPSPTKLVQKTFRRLQTILGFL